jgi:uncharacterized membrane protein YgcG
MASLRDAFAALTGRRRRPEPAVVLPRVPTGAELLEQINRIGPQIQGKVPSMVQFRVDKITGTLRETIPRLNQLGGGSRDAHSVMATVTSYLPEALGAYLRLPRSFADRRPIEGGKTALLILIDQLDLLAATMDEIFEAVCRSDADALVAHGRFLAEKFGKGSGALDVGDLGSGGAGGAGGSGGAGGAGGGGSSGGIGR